jgi:hypothetical protein
MARPIPGAWMRAKPLTFTLPSVGRRGASAATRRTEGLLHLSFVVPGAIKMLNVKLTRGKGSLSPRGIIFARDGFILYQKTPKELRLRAPTPSPRRLRRFLRDYARNQGGKPSTVTWWIT